jgi:hemoglobin
MKSAYERLGGSDGVRRLVETFYDIVETRTEGHPLMALHNQGHGLNHAREAQFEFLSGFLGGPQLYYEHYRHSNVKRMHAHLAIGPRERDSWIRCMQMALDAQPLDAEFKLWLMAHFSRVANMLADMAPVNRPEQPH